MLLCVVPTPPKRLRRPEAPPLAGRYVARVSRMALPTDAARLSGSASVGFNLSNVSLFVNNLINN